MNSRIQREPLTPGRIRPGTILFGRYLVDSKLGEGGMGSVWLVRHQELDTFRALKLIVPGIAFDPQARDRFRREARVMARLSHHPNAVVVHDVRMGKDVAFIEMEYIRGQCLDQVMLPGVPMPPDRVARILEQLCDVLQEAHDRMIIHRDLKPSNLMIVEDCVPERERLKVLDFGIAKIVEGDDGGGESLTDTGAFLGSTPWTSPEQASSGRVDGRSDIYSIGVILYAMLTGRRPFSGPKLKIISDHISSHPPAFAQKNPDARVPREVERVVMRCLAKDPEDRPHTPRELDEEFRKALGVAPSRAARAPRVERSLPRAEDDLMGRQLARFGLRPEATVPWTEDAISLAPADSEVIADKLPSRVRTETSVNRGKRVVRALVVGCLFLTCCPSDAPQLAPEKMFEIGGVPMEFVLLPGKGIYLGKYEVTNRQYRDFRRHRGLPAPEKGFDGPDHPAVDVSFQDFEEFCKRATEQSQGRLTVRPLTEEEWVKAAGAEESGLAPGRGNFEGPGNDPFPGLAPVGRFPANPRGLHDMFGNAWEWVEGESREQAREHGRLRVLRGGSFGSDLGLLREGGRARDERPEDSRHPTVGFRVVVVPSAGF